MVYIKQGVDLSKKEGKKIFLYFYADWCAYCKKMEQATFKNYLVIAYLNDNFIPIKLNSDRELKIALDFGVKGLLSIWFIAENGDKISRLEGNMNSEMLHNILQYINTDSYKYMSFSKFKTNI